MCVFMKTPVAEALVKSMRDLGLDFIWVIGEVIYFVYGSVSDDGGIQSMAIEWVRGQSLL